MPSLHTLIISGAVAVAAIALFTALPGRADKLPPHRERAISVEATLCKSLNGDDPVDPTTTFTRDTPKLYGAWRSKDGREGMSYKVVWIADDTGGAAPANTTIDQSTGTMSDKKIGKKATWWSGNFSLSKPTAGWPAGKYHVDLYFNDKLAKTLPFTIQ